jgi:hypothetical protein
MLHCLSAQLHASSGDLRRAEAALGSCPTRLTLTRPLTLPGHVTHRRPSTPAPPRRREARRCSSSSPSRAAGCAARSGCSCTTRTPLSPFPPAAPLSSRSRWRGRPTRRPALAESGPRNFTRDHQRSPAITGALGDLHRSVGLGPRGSRHRLWSVLSLRPRRLAPTRLETSRLRPACRRPLDGGSRRARRAAPDIAARGGGRARRGKLRAARGVRVGPARAHPLEPFFVLSVQGGQLPDRDGGGEGRAEGGVGGRSLAVDGGSISLRYCVVSTND